MANVALLANIADQTASQTAGGAAELVPSGTVFPFAGSSAPTGWLICDGASLDTTQYAKLFAVIGYTYGGSGNNFNLPDCRGIFISGTGSQAIGGVTYTRTHGAKQGDIIKGHNHMIFDFSGTSNGEAITHSAQPNQNGSFFNSAGNPSTIPYIANWPNADLYTAKSVASEAATGETRPANIAMNHIIKV